MLTNWLRNSKGKDSRRGKSGCSLGRWCKPAIEALEMRDLPTGTWTPLANLAPSTTGTMMLLSDGTVMAEEGGVSKRWFRLTPDATGSFVNGTWSSMPSMGLERLYFGSNVLQDGRMLVLGGEYSGPSGSQNITNTGEIYDPVANTWTAMADFPRGEFGDDPTALLPDGKVIAGYIFGPETFIYDPVANTWSPGGSKLNGDRSDEESWVKLPDDSLLTYNVFSSQTSQRYVPSLDQWVDSGTVPVQLETSGAELGPGLLLHDGRVLFIGGTSTTALYTPSTTLTGTGSWVTGPTIPGNLGANDAPGAVMPDGKVLFDVGQTPNFGNGVSLYEFDPATNALTAVTTPSALTSALNNVPAYVTRMLALPSGQILFTDYSSQLWAYTPAGTPQNSWRPTISGITPAGAGVYTLTGTQLNGLSEGASYGDDAEMSSNYPLIRLTDSTGNVTYLRTFQWSSTGVATGSTPVSTKFNLPTGLAPGHYTLEVVANGIPSAGFGIDIDNDTIIVAGVAITESGGSTTVTEAGATDDYSVVLTSRPTSNVTVVLHHDSHVTLTPSTLVFMPATWDKAQKVTVKALNDKIAQATNPYTSTITATVTSGDSHYATATASNVVVNIIDDDGPGVTILESGGSTGMVEGGLDTFTVVLNTKPTGSVTVTLTPDAQETLSSTSLVFTTADWNRARTVIVRAVDDRLVQGTHIGSITLAVSSADASYQALGPPVIPASISVIIKDNDVPGVVVAQTANSTRVSVGSLSDTYTLVLKTQPASDVTITVDGGPLLNVSPSVLVFTSTGNGWSTPQTVTVTAIDDGHSSNSTVATINHTVTGAAGYAGILVQKVLVSIIGHSTPTLSAFANRSVPTSAIATALSPIPFTVGSTTIGAVLTATATSSNQAVVQDAGLVTSGTGAIRSLSVTPVAGASGVTTITVTVSDGVRSIARSFELQVFSSTTLPFSDTFDQQTLIYLGGQWQTWAGRPYSDGSKVVAGALGWNLATVYATAVADVSVQADISVTSGALNAASLVARYYAPAGGSMYEARVSAVAATGKFVAQIYRIVHGAEMLLASTYLATGTGSLRFDAIGTSLSLYFNGSLVCQTNDSAIIFAGAVGLRLRGTGTIDNFTAN